MKLTIENLKLIQTPLKEKQLYLFFPELKDHITTGYFLIDIPKISLPLIGWIRTNYCLSRYSSINKGGKLSSSSKISFNHNILCCKLGFQVKALPKFTKLKLTALIINKSIKQWGYEAYLEGGPKSMVKKPPFSSKLWKNLQKNLQFNEMEQIKIFPLYGGWNQKLLTSYYLSKKKQYLSLVFGLQGSFIKKSLGNLSVSSLKKKSFFTVKKDKSLK